MHEVKTTRVAIAICGALAALAPACGDDGGQDHADAGVTADSMVGADGAVGPDGSLPSVATIVAGDFDTTGVLSTVELAGLAVTPNVIAGVASGDPWLRRIGDRLYVINRDAASNVTILDANTHALVDQFSTGAGSNPWDVAVRGGKLYVAALGSAGVVVVDTQNDGALSTIDLSSFDPDGKPNCVSTYIVGNRLFAVCALLDDTQQFLPPRGVGKVMVVDLNDGNSVQSFDLANENPFGVFQRAPETGVLAGDLVIATVPSFTDYSTGCLERVTTGATPALNGCVVDNQAMNGYANRYEFDGDTLWLAISAFDESFNSFGTLAAKDLTASTPGVAAKSPNTQIISDLALCSDGHVIAADTTFGAAGIRVYTASGERTSTPLDIGMPPNYGNNLACN